MISLLGSLFQTFLREASWQTILDIGFMSLIFFFLYRTFRSTGTWKIAAGILFAAFFLLLSFILGLRGIMWIYDRLSPVVLIALVVVFQPEIRKIFERAASLRRHKKEKADPAQLGVLADAAFALAKRRWGAIFVVPGNDPIGAWTSGGININADASVPLILSIFDPNSPGHDGAIEVDYGHIAKMSLRLPLTQSSRLPADLGTRHNASAGLAENTDALVITVSEERGTVTVFHKTEMRPVKDSGELAMRLQAHYEERSATVLEESGRVIKSAVPQALGSLALASLLWAWVVVGDSQTIERNYAVPIQYQTAAEMELDSDRPFTGRVHVTAPRREIEKIDPSRLRIALDLRKTTAGAHTMEISKANINLPDNITLLEVEPSEISVQVRRKPVEPAEISVQVKSKTSEEN